jgi:hypothetical protein
MLKSASSEEQSLIFTYLWIPVRECGAGNFLSHLPECEVFHLTLQAFLRYKRLRYGFI